MVMAMTSDATRLKNALRSWSHAVTVDANRRMGDYARQDAPRVTGELAESIGEVPVRSLEDRFVGGLIASVIQAATTDKGARPHVIRPRRRGGRLVFYWPKAGGTVAFAKVNHPGNRGTGWWKATHERRWPRALRAAARARRL